MDKIKKYCKENKLFVLVMAIGLILAFLQITTVVMYADDYSIGIHSKNSGLIGAWNYFTNNYINWGGGWTGFQVVCILTIGITLWYIIEIILVFSIVGLIIKFGKFDKDKEKAMCALLTWSLYFFLSIYISRETFLWLDGSLAYVLTTLELILFIYLFYTRVNYEKKRKKYDYFILPIVSLFAGWSTAQPGAMASAAAVIILLFTQFINKKKIPKFYYFCALLAITGYGIFYFAPGNSARMLATAADFAKLGLVDRVLTKTSSLFISLFDCFGDLFTGIPFYLFLVMALLSIVSFYFIKNENKKKIKTLLLIASLYNILFLLIILYIKLNLPYSSTLTSLFMYNNLYQARINGSFRILHLASYAIASLSILCTIIQAGYISLKRKDSLLFIIVGCGLLSQIIMLMAPTHPYRTLLIAVILFMIAIVLLIKYLNEYKMEWHYGLIFVLLLFNINFGILFLVIYFVLYKILKYFAIDFNKYAYLVPVVVLLIVSFVNYANITINYSKNKKINNENVKRIEKYIEEPNENKTIVFKRFDNEMYGFSQFAGTEWIENDVKKYFGLDPDVKFMYEDELIENISE